ncbi:hypothetical protein TRAPUB_10489 [Trametes pubescens]|uniref:Uncharacterized protein n=1 Tax=Trametes pubescens TaxID=154538 RepID=A0A1M2VZ78_TRAPU|nr:hypothetical protein TRAPUB_10489 [Trametes pubescens]
MQWLFGVRCGWVGWSCLAFAFAPADASATSPAPREPLLWPRPVAAEPQLNLGARSGVLRAAFPATVRSAADA